MEIMVEVSFEHELTVSDGSYMWKIPDVEMPIQLDSFTVRADNVELLSITTKIFLIPITITRNGIDGVAVFSQRGVPSGKYWMQLSGLATRGAEKVQLSITASSTIVTDETGEYVYIVSTNNIPSGDFTVKIGDITKTIHLAPRDSPVLPNNNNAPVAVSHHPVSTYTGDAILFNATESSDPEDNIIEYTWSLGDGSILSGVTVSHVYTKPGLYIVSLIVVDELGETSIASTSIEVYKPNELPKADAGPDRNVFVNNPVLLNASNSYDTDSESLDYTWWINATIHYGVTTSWTPELSGKYVVRLTVTDEENGTDMDEMIIRVIESHQPVKETRPRLLITLINIPDKIFTNREYNITWIIKNNGNQAYTDVFTLMVDNHVLHEETHEVSPNELEIINFIWRPKDIGAHNLSLSIDAPPDIINTKSSLLHEAVVSRDYSSIPAYTFPILFLILVAARAFFKSRRHSKHNF